MMRNITLKVDGLKLCGELYLPESSHAPPAAVCICHGLPARRFDPAKCLGAEKQIIQGNPDTSKISTSYVERQNLTMRMCMRRFTRLTNAFSKKLENHTLALALYFMHYNYARPHKSLANPYPTTPAMASGLTNRIWTVEQIVRLVSD